jgi:hypothetical protein
MQYGQCSCFCSGISTVRQKENQGKICQESKGERMMDNLNLKPQSPDEVKTMMWTGENQREMFDLLTCGKKIDDYMTASGENFFIDHNAVKGGLVLITNVGNQCGCEIPVK